MKTVYFIPLAAVTALVAVGITDVVRRGKSPLEKIEPSNINRAMEPASVWPVPDFSMLDQDSRIVSTRDLEGKVWIANFMFTGCAGACPVLSKKMQQLQSDLPGVHLVSFDVDPDHDTPAKLSEYGRGYHADFSRWHFLASRSRAEIFELAKGMKVTSRRDDADFQLLHSDNFYLVDRTGHVRGVYDSNSESRIIQLKTDAQAL